MKTQKKEHSQAPEIAKNSQFKSPEIFEKALCNIKAYENAKEGLMKICFWYISQIYKLIFLYNAQVV